MTDANQFEINELARELEVKAKPSLTCCPVTASRKRRRTRSSIPEASLRKCARTFRGRRKPKRKWKR